MKNINLGMKEIIMEQTIQKNIALGVLCALSLTLTNPAQATLKETATQKLEDAYKGMQKQWKKIKPCITKAKCSKKQIAVFVGAALLVLGLVFRKRISMGYKIIQIRRKQGGTPLPTPEEALAAGKRRARGIETSSSPGESLEERKLRYRTAHQGTVRTIEGLDLEQLKQLLFSVHAQLVENETSRKIYQAVVEKWLAEKPEEGKKSFIEDKVIGLLAQLEQRELQTLMERAKAHPSSL